jgi:hypothetical protein
VCEVAGEPVPGQPGGGIEGAGLLEQVTGARHHGQVILAPQLRLGAAVEVQHHLIVPADDQEHGRGHGREAGTFPGLPSFPCLPQVEVVLQAKPAASVAGSWASLAKVTA